MRVTLLSERWLRGLELSQYALLSKSSAIHSLDELVPACARGPAGGAATAADTGCGGSWAWWVENWASRWTEMLESQQADGGSEPHVADIASMLDLRSAVR